MDYPRRKHTRLPDFDYGQAGWYFVTICTHGKRPWFGKITNGKTSLNVTGETVRKCWFDIPNHHAQATLDEFVIMPNHIHGVVVIEKPTGGAGEMKTGDAGVAPTRGTGQQSPGPGTKSLSSIVGSFKSAVSRKRQWSKTNNQPLWQRGFFEHVIRTEAALDTIREYIANNPLAWELDKFNQIATGSDAFDLWIKQQGNQMLP